MPPTPKTQLAVLQTLGLTGLLVQTAACGPCLDIDPGDSGAWQDTGDTAEDDRPSAARTRRAAATSATPMAAPTAAPTADVIARNVLPDDVAAALAARLRAQRDD
jgi:hypothetical protein